MTISFARRTFFQLGVGAVSPSLFTMRDLALDDGGPSRLARVYWPRDAPGGDAWRILVLFHGLGETHNEAVGVRAWAERYGLLDAHQRLAKPPVAPVGRRGELTGARAEAINAELAARPFDPRVVYVCPFTPNVWRMSNPDRALERLSEWTVATLLPEVRSRLPGAASPDRTTVDGCSLGGFIGLEVFLRRPRAFAAWGGTQSALREASAPTWASRLAQALGEVGPRPLRIATSRGDPFMRANRALASELARRGLHHDLLIAPGPHDQPWLREVGSLEMLLWHTRLAPSR